MHFTVETSRTEPVSALSFAEKRFAGKLHGATDAVYADAKKDHVYAYTGLPYYAPVMTMILSDPALFALFEKAEDDVLFVRENEGTKVFCGHKAVPLSAAAEKALDSLYRKMISSPGKLNENGELEYDLTGIPVGSHYTVNLLLGDRSEYADCLQSTPKAALDAFGRGSFRGKQEKQVLATRYVLSLEENGEPANRQFYLTENGKQIFYTLDVRHNVKSAKCVHGVNHTVITYETECGLRIRRTIFLLPQKPGMPSAAEVQHIEIENLSGRKRNLRIVVTGMFGITNPGTLSQDIVFANVVVESELYCLNGKPIAMTAHHKPKECDAEKRFAMILADGEPMDEYCSNLRDFLGTGDYDHPDMIARLSNRPSRREAAFFAMAKSFTLQDKITVDSFAGMSDKEPDVRAEFDEDLYHFYMTFREKGAVQHALKEVKDNMRRYTSYLTMKTGDALYDSYVSHTLPFQVLYQTYVSRSFAWTQKSYRETGFREIQDIFASMYYMHANNQDALIRKLISSWAENVFEFGYAYHNFTTRGKEPGMCSDDQLWLVQAVYRYITLTGDTGYLDEKIPVAGSRKTRPLYKTLESILRYSGKISVGKHGLPLLDTADWNDCLRLDKNVLDGPAKEKLYARQRKKSGKPFGSPLENDQSESVMNACLLKIAADETAELCAGKYPEIASFASEISENIKASVRENAWKNDYYARCLINDGRGYTYLGSSGDNLSLDPSVNGTYYLNGFSWPVLADIADEEQIGTMLDVIDRYLKTDAGLKLVTPVDYDKLGIVTGSSFYFPGDRENGGVFKHAAMMCTAACLQKAKTAEDPALALRLRDLAFFMMEKTLPYKTLENPFVLKGNPRFCTQYNNSETGEGIGPVLSGTASWLTLAIYEIAGIHYENGKLDIRPVPAGESLSYTLNVQGKILNVVIHADNQFRLGNGSRKMLDGKPICGPFDIPEGSFPHTLEVFL